MKKYLKYIITFLILEVIIVSFAVWHTQTSLADSTTEKLLTQVDSSIPKVNNPEAKSTSSTFELTETTETIETINDKSIALTFDDGPKKQTTNQLLDILAQKKVKASFFILGQNISGNEDILKRMKDENHLIGSHSMHHHNLSQLNISSLKKDFSEMDEKINSLFNEPFKYIRPPFGAANKQVAQVANRPLIQWSVDSKDWSSRNTQAIVNEVTQNTTPGSIILMHDIYTETIHAVPTIIDNLTQQGYNFVTVDALLKQPTENLNYYSIHDNRPAS